MPPSVLLNTLVLAFIFISLALVPLLPLIPATAKPYENSLFIVTPPHVTGIVIVPVLVVKDVVTVIVILVDVVPLLFIVAVIPVGNPLIVPTVQAVALEPL